MNLFKENNFNLLNINNAEKDIFLTFDKEVFL